MKMYSNSLWGKKNKLLRKADTPAILTDAKLNTNPKGMSHQNKDQNYK